MVGYQWSIIDENGVKRTRSLQKKNSPLNKEFAIAPQGAIG